MNSTLVIILLIAAFSSWALWSSGRLPMPFRSRNCQGKGWRRAFPDASKEGIRNFLTVFVQAFAFSEGERLKLRPQDLVLDVYRVLYPHRWQADAMELETLAQEVECEYGIDLEGLWNDQLTLGELFAACLAAQAKVTPRESS